MSIQIKTKETGIVYEATYAVDPIDINSEVIQLGRFMIPFGDFPAYTPVTVPYYLPNANREANEFKIAKYDLEFAVACQAVNGIPVYLIMGKSTTTALVHKITALEVGTDKQSFTNRFKYESDQINQIKHNIGCKMVGLTFEFDFISLRIPQFILVMKGLQIVAPGFPEENAPVIPGSDIRFDKPASVRWNSLDPTSGGEDLSAVMGNFAYQIMDISKLEDPEINEQFVRKIIDGEIVYIVKFSLLRGKTITPITYQQNFTNDTTPINMAARFPRSSTQYHELIMTGVYPKTAIKKENRTKETEFDTYEFWVKSLSWNWKDGLDETIYYGE